MQFIITALRAVVLVVGISALAVLANSLLSGSGLREFLIMRQQSWPGALLAMNVVADFSFAFFVLGFSYLVAHGYWRNLFPAHFNWLLFALCIAGGMVFEVFLNHPSHVLLFSLFYGEPVFNTGDVSDSMVGGIFRSLDGQGVKFSLATIATIVLTPITEEITDRGIFFKETEGLPIWLVALLSFLIFCLSHYAAGSMAKVLAVAPVAALFVGLRMKTGSFVYSAAAHAGINLAAVMKLQMF
jgi:hypothetical protein